MNCEPAAQPSPTIVGSLHGKSAVVTGASTGIGRATAVRLAELGADVFIHARTNTDELAKTAAAIQACGRQTGSLLCDLAGPGDDGADPAGSERINDPVAQLVTAAYAWRDDIDIWINNAGADVLTTPARHGSFEEKLQQLWQVDVLATMRLSRAVGQRMREAATVSGAHSIVNIGWDQALTGMGGDSGQLFAATKAAVISFTLSLAKTLAPAVRVNCVAPGWIKTAWGQAASATWDRRARQEALLERWGQPEEVAQVVAFLVSPAAAFVNAQLIEVNGGFRGAEPNS